jgi:hypothetical protein
MIWLLSYASHSYTPIDILLHIWSWAIPRRTSRTDFGTAPRLVLFMICFAFVRLILLIFGRVMAIADLESASGSQIAFLRTNND